MSLRNLLKTGQLIEHQTDITEVRRLLAATRRVTSDAENDGIGAETRFDAAYRVIMQSATAALWVNGYRPSTSMPGNHRTIIQTLVHTAGIDGSRIAVLDRLRHKRNLVDYTGEDIDDTSVDACIQEAQRLIDDVEAWINNHHPEFLRT